MLEKISNKKAVIVMDAGIATEDNIEWLNDNDYNSSFDKISSCCQKWHT